MIVHTTPEDAIQHRAVLPPGAPSTVLVWQPASAQRACATLNLTSFKRPPSLLSGEEMTAPHLFLGRSGGQLAVRSIHFTVHSVLYAVARDRKKVAVLIKVFAMTLSPTHRFMPSSPW